MIHSLTVKKVFLYLRAPFFSTYKRMRTIHRMNWKEKRYGTHGGVTLMGFSPAHIKRCTLTWEAPDYSASYPAGYTDQGVAVIAVAQEHRTAQGFCYSALSTVVLFLSRTAPARW